jgi:hypothetical protein
MTAAELEAKVLESNTKIAPERVFILSPLVSILDSSFATPAPYGNR